MIKESFLRNYSLSKIYCQAEDQKKKLKVFYVRHVQKILKEKHNKQRQAAKLKKTVDNKQWRLKGRQQIQQILNSRKTTIKMYRECTIKTQQDQHISKAKIDLRIKDLKFADDIDHSGFESSLDKKKWNVTAGLHKSFHKKMMSSMSGFNKNQLNITQKSDIQAIDTKFHIGCQDTNPSFHQSIPKENKLRKSNHQQNSIPEKESLLKRLKYFHISKSGKASDRNDENQLINRNKTNNLFIQKLQANGLLECAKKWMSASKTPKIL